MKIFGREPALWINAIMATLAILSSMWADLISPGQAFAVGGLLTAIITAATTRPIGPALFTGILTAIVALLAEYGTQLEAGLVATISAGILTLFTLITRQQVSPAHDVSPEVLGEPVAVRR